jgi:hypothetical protein
MVEKDFKKTKKKKSLAVVVTGDRGNLEELREKILLWTFERDSRLIYNTIADERLWVIKDSSRTGEVGPYE